MPGCQAVAGKSVGVREDMEDFEDIHMPEDIEDAYNFRLTRDVCAYVFYNPAVWEMPYSAQFELLYITP